jgi:hypothetical protein
MPDYNKIVKTAERLINNSGRSITFVKFKTTLQDQNKPWRGADDPRRIPADYFDCIGTFVEPASTQTLGVSYKVDDLLKRSEKMVLVSTQEELSEYHEIIDSFEEERWKITGIEKLQPATTTILYFVGLSR